jgi:6-pyruvoyltetrahydropterin/6-carboxytetrahydropterin synthase
MKMTLKKEFLFEAAHKLPNHDGKCQRLHGHSWKMRVVVVGDHLHNCGPKQGMLTDYAEISAIVKPVVEMYLDHHYLNETLKLENPTSECICIWLYEYLKPQLPLLASVEIDETCTSSCLYVP